MASFNDNKNLLYFNNSFKGESGALLIIGGSDLYTGAPYFVSEAGFKMGIDLVYILTFSKKAEISLKMLSPSTITTTNVTLIIKLLKRIKICVIGPGLGDISQNLNEIIMIIKKIEEKIVILDGDILRFMDYVLNILKNNNNYLIATPNIHEQSHLKKSSNKSLDIVVKKSIVDKISEFKEGNLIKMTQIRKPINLKRCCGQGDILCGIIAGLMRYENIEKHQIVKISCKILRKAGKRCFNKYGYGYL